MWSGTKFIEFVWHHCCPTVETFQDNWNAGVARCEHRQGGRLAEVRSQEQQDFVAGRLSAAGLNTSVYMAANDLGYEGVWMWNHEDASRLSFFAWNDDARSTRYDCPQRECVVFDHSQDFK